MKIIRPWSRSTLIIGILYWSVPLVLFLLQLLLTLQTTNQIRSEELAESVRNVYWLEHRAIYDGVSSNVGWYGILLVCYKLFGFSLFTAKYVRLGLHLISLLCLAELLRRWMGAKKAWVPLLVMGLSPALLYLNTLQTSYGVDLHFIPICLLLMWSTRFEQTWQGIVKTAACWSIAMIASMSYPTFLFYIPPMILVYIWQFRDHRMRLNNRWVMLYLLTSLLAFVLPLVGAIAYVKVPLLLLRDPVTGAGLFRGGGRLDVDVIIIGKSLMRSLRDLFVSGESYYFELGQPDFSNIWTFASLSFITVVAGILFIKKKALRPVLAAIFLLLLINLVVPSLSSGGCPGLRRCTGLLVAFYAMFAIVWKYFCDSFRRYSWLSWAGVCICLLIPLHHMVVYPANFSEIDKPSRYRYGLWFSAKGSPIDSLEFLLSETAKGRYLGCLDYRKRHFACRYGEIFAALAGYRLWNGMEEKPIRAYDWKTGRVIPLSIDLWDNYYFPH